MEIPTVKELLIPTLLALRKLGGTASIHQIAEVVIQQLNLPEEIINRPHGQSRQTEAQYRLAWARTSLKNYGLVSNLRRGVWVLTTQSTFDSAFISDEVVVAKWRQTISETLASAHQSPTCGYSSMDSFPPGSYQADSVEDDLWNRMTAEQFLAGYSESDSVYDTI